jgi:hypothetical protein
MARPAPGRAGSPVMLALAATAVTVAVAGCATAPAGGPPRPAPGAGNQAQAYVQELPFPGPTSKWLPQDVVLGFLHASASYAFDPAAARRFLAPAARKQWHPGGGPVAVLSSAPTKLSAEPFFSKILGAPDEETVSFTGQLVATLSQTGQYQYAPGQTVYNFQLARINDVWRIESLPKSQSLLLTESDFDEVYQPRNLFFYAPPASGKPPTVLVPDPVYAPEQSSNSAFNSDLATGLVNGLIKGQGGWLSGATVSAFPAGTRLLKKVTITGNTATVDLGGAAAHAQETTIGQMEGQLFATLGDGEYSPPLATHLALYINNKPYTSNAQQSASAYSDTFTAQTPAQVLLVTGNGLGQLPPVPKPGVRPQSLPSPAQIAPAEVTAVAASPPANSPDQDRPQQFAVAVTNDPGCGVEVRPGSQSTYASYDLSTAAGPCTSLSWDSDGNLWAVAGHAVWVFRPNQPPAPVNVAAVWAALPSGSQILALRMAPSDAVRAALLVSTPTGNKVLLAAVRFRFGTASLGPPVSVSLGTSDPLAISWYDPFHLAVLASGGGIYEVPLTGGAGQPGGSPNLLSTAPPNAHTLSTDGSELVVGTNDNQVFAGSVSAPSLTQVAEGEYPIYPG